MSDTFDVFAEINLDEFKGKAEKSAKKVSIEKKDIRQVAEQNNFKSREAVKPAKKPAMNRTFSLFEEDFKVIEKATSNYIQSPKADRYTVSASDIVRAALAHFSELPPEEQVIRVMSHRGRMHR